MSVLLLVFVSGAHAQSAAVGDLFVTTDTPGARVLVDGVDSGQVTPTMLRGVAAGPHEVTAKTACSVGKQSVKVTPGAIARAELGLATMPGTLTVTATPTTATVTVDGKAMGTAPWTGNDLVCGEHIVAVEAPDYVSQKRRVAVAAGETSTVDVKLEIARFGTLVVDVSPFDAAVRLDGQDVGAGPRTIEHLPAGAHTVEASDPKHAKASTTLDLAPDDTVRVTLALDAPKGSPRTSVTSAASAAAPPPAPASVPATPPEPPASASTKQAAKGKNTEPASSPSPAPAAAPAAPTATASTAATPVATTAPVATAAPPPATTMGSAAPPDPSPVPAPAAAAPLPTTSSTATIRRHAQGGRIAANVGVTVAGLGAGVAAGLVYAQAAAHYQEFLAEPNDDEAGRIFEEEVKPRQTMAIALGAGAVALLGTSGVLWATTDFHGNTTVGVTGTF